MRDEWAKLGPLNSGERATLAETVYTVLRQKLFFEHCAPSGSGPKERRLTILGFSGPRELLAGADLAIANAVCHELVDSNWVNEEFVRHHVSFRRGRTDPLRRRRRAGEVRMGGL